MVQKVASVPFFKGLPAWALREFAEEAGERSLDRNEYVLHQHDEANSVYFLLDGSVQFLLRFEGVDDLLVGTTREPGAMIGWSVFRAPYRFTSSVRCEEPCTLLRVSRETFERIIDHDPQLGYLILRRAASVLAGRVEQTRDLLVGSPRRNGAVPRR